MGGWRSRDEKGIEPGLKLCGERFLACISFEYFIGISLLCLPLLVAAVGVCVGGEVHMMQSPERQAGNLCQGDLLNSHCLTHAHPTS